MPHSHTSIHYTGKAYDMQAVAPWKKRSDQTERCRLSKKWLAPLFRGVHSSLRLRRGQGAMQGNPATQGFLRFDAHPPGGLLLSFGTIHLVSPNPIIASLRPPSPQGFLDKLGPACSWGAAG